MPHPISSVDTDDVRMFLVFLCPELRLQSLRNHFGTSSFTSNLPFQRLYKFWNRSSNHEQNKQHQLQ